MSLFFAGRDGPALTRPAAPGGPGGYFRHHGLLAPAVRLFRRIGFPAKAGWVAAAFLVPLAWMLAVLWNSAGEQMAFAASERAGLLQIKPLLALVEAAQARRLAASGNGDDLAPLQARVRSAFDALPGEPSAAAERSAFGEALNALRTLHEPLLAQALSSDANATFERHSQYIDAALAAIRAAADASQLTLDPDLDTYHLMNVAVLRGPVQAEYLTRLRDFGTLALQRDVLTAPERERLARWDAVWAYLDREVENSYQTGVAALPDAEASFGMKAADDAADAFRTALHQQLLGAALVGEAATYAELGQQAKDRQHTLNVAVMAQLDSRLDARIERLHSMRVAQVAVSAVFIGLAGYLLMAFYRVMRGGLAEVARHLREISAGNLSTEPKPWGNDEAAGLMLTLAEMQRSLRQLVGGVLGGAAQVQTASDEIAAASADLATRTAQATCSLQQTAATMAQISGVAAHALAAMGNAQQSLTENAHEAQRGGEAIADVVQTMGGIRASSTRIGEITGVIDGLAFQTHILALNAAVEAARAGEHGRGFSIVAAEVQALAARSASAARQIRALIGSSIEQVESGTAVVARAGDIVQAVVTNAGRVARLMAEVAAGAGAQTRSVDEVGVAVHQLDAAMQQDAAVVEQTAAAAAALSDQARRLCAEVGSFRLA